jgi:hypothetical protein
MLEETVVICGLAFLSVALCITVLGEFLLDFYSSRRQ